MSAHNAICVLFVLQPSRQSINLWRDRNELLGSAFTLPDWALGINLIPLYPEGQVTVKPLIAALFCHLRQALYGGEETCCS